MQDNIYLNTFYKRFVYIFNIIATIAETLKK
jgi:hypothetical protein